MADKSVKMIIIKDQTFCVGDKVNLYFVEHVEEIKSKGRKIVEREFTISDIYKRIITVRDCFGFATSFSHWEFSKRLSEPRIKKDSRGNRLFLFAGDCVL